MKKIITIFILIFLVFTKPIYSQAIDLPISTTSLTPSPGPALVNYELPYPGILPGSPLYMFKYMRDKIKEFTTIDTVKKTEFFLLQADKQLASALLLYKQNQNALADDTLKKSQDNLDKSIDSLIESKKTQKIINDLPAKIKTSSTKQKQEISALLESNENNKIKTLNERYNRAEQIENRANSFNP
jgi:hypothetical protein